jgi:cytochrome c553
MCLYNPQLIFVKQHLDCACQMKPSLSILFKTLVASATLGMATAASAQVAGNVEAGQAKAAMCIGCHGIPGYQNSFPEIHKVPKISGQTKEFLAASLVAYQKGDRRHPTMRGISGTLTEEDIADLAAFYATHNGGVTVAETPSRQPSTSTAALLERGACVSCHGANFSSPIDPSYPKLGGQYADYLYVALKSYKIEGNRVIGRNNAIMSSIVQQYTLRELREMANYIASLEGEMATRPQSRFR